MTSQYSELLKNNPNAIDECSTGLGRYGMASETTLTQHRAGSIEDKTVQEVKRLIGTGQLNPTMLNANSTAIEIPSGQVDFSLDGCGALDGREHD